MHNIYNIQRQSIGDIVILSCFERGRELKRAYNNRLINEFEGFYPGFTLSFGEKKITVITTGSGSARVGDAVLTLQNSTCRFVFYTGAAGGIGDLVRVGDLVAPHKAIIGDGFSVYHRSLIQGDLFANHVNSTKFLVKKFQTYVQDKINIKLHIGDIFTIESIFAETQEFLAKLEGRDITAIDMETSAFFTAAQKINIPCMALHYISDLPQVGDTPNIFHKKCSKSYVKLPYLLIDFIRDVLINHE